MPSFLVYITHSNMYSRYIYISFSIICVTFNNSSNKKILQKKSPKKSSTEQISFGRVTYIIKGQLILMGSWNELGTFSFLSYYLSDKHVWEMIKTRHLIFLLSYYCSPTTHKSNMPHRLTCSCSYNMAIKRLPD